MWAKDIVFGNFFCLSKLSQTYPLYFTRSWADYVSEQRTGPRYAFSASERTGLLLTILNKLASVRIDRTFESSNHRFIFAIFWQFVRPTIREETSALTTKPCLRPILLDSVLAVVRYSRLCFSLFSRRKAQTTRKGRDSQQRLWRRHQNLPSRE